MKEQVIEKLSALVTAAFGLVAALAWNSAIQKFFRDVFGEQSSLGAMVGYAVLVTIIAVTVTLWVGKVAEKAKAVADKTKNVSVRCANHIKTKIKNKIPFKRKRLEEKPEKEEPKKEPDNAEKKS